LSGYAAVFDQRTDLGYWYEEIAPGAFDQVLASPHLDTRALFNHDANLLLGRSASGTLTMGTDSHGLEYDILLPNTSVGNDVYELAQRGDLTGASFAFIPGDLEVLDGGAVDRHTRVDALYDVSPVTYPAYKGTETMARSREGARRSTLDNRRRAALLRHKMRGIVQ
jgi:HK97 family phage prohead protease